MTARRGANRIIAAAISAFIAIALVWSSAEAQKKKKSSKPRERQVLFLDINIDLTYDDNVINYSDADLDIYDQEQNPDKFEIKSQDDWIITSRVQPRLKGKFISGRTAWLDLEFTHYHYMDNDVRRYQKYGLTGRQYFRRGGYVELEYYYIPDYYYRNQLVQDTWIKASFSKHSVKAEIGYDILPNLKGDLSYRFQSKTFNSEIDERDLEVNGFRLDAIWRATKNFKLWAYYGLRRATAAGADFPDDLDVRDVSYDAWDITLGVRHYSALFKRLKPQLVSTIEFSGIRFRTTNYRDVYRFGREDLNLRFRIGISWRLLYAIRLDIDYRYQQKDSDLFYPSYTDALEYDSNSITFRLKRGF
jgi:hypothetical protein